MKPSTTLITSLRKRNLLPAGNVEIDGYYQLETTILNYVASLPELPTSVVWFDGECIESKGAYAGLLYELIKAADCQSEVRVIQCEVDFDRELAICRASRNGLLVEASWAQQLDWVTPEFLEFTAKLLNCEEGEFVAVATADQTYLTVFLPARVLRSFNVFKTRDTKSRDGFFLQRGEAVKQRYGKIKILPIDKYRFVLRQFKSSFIKDGPVSAIGSYHEGRAIEVAYCGRWNAALEAHRLITHHAIATDLYADLTMYEYEDVCPDESCYFLSFDAAHDQVIFSHDAKYVPTIVGSFSFDQSVGEHLVVGHNMDWAVYVKKHSVICVGEPSMTLATSLTKSIQENETAKYFDMFIENHFRPTLDKLGYDFDDEKYSTGCTKDNGEMHSAFYLKGSQREAPDPLEIAISVKVLCPAIESMLRDDYDTTKPRFYMVDKCPGDSTENRWAMGGSDDYEAMADEMCRFIADHAMWASKAGINQELLTIYEKNEQFIHAAAVASRMGREKQASELVERGLEHALTLGPTSREKLVAMAAALGLNADGTK